MRFLKSFSHKNTIDMYPMYQEKIFEGMDLFLMKSELSRNLENTQSMMSFFKIRETDVAPKILSKEEQKVFDLGD